jgi:predicted lipoprotein
MVIARRNALLLFFVVALGGCKIVDNRDLMTARGKADSEFDAAAYVDKIWESKALPEFKSKAVDLDTALQAVAEDPDKAGKTYGQRAGEGNPWTYEIKGQGKVVAVDTASRHAILTVEAETKSGPRKVDLQVGPVVFGTAVRDALPFRQSNSVRACFPRLKRPRGEKRERFVRSERRCGQDDRLLCGRGVERRRYDHRDACDH